MTEKIWPECAKWRALDKKFNTSPQSPLHHDNRCTSENHPRR